MWSSHQPILGANNNPLAICGITEIDVTIGDTVIHPQAYVCKDLAQELLLGADFFRMHNCVINFEQETIRIGDRAYKMESTSS